MAVLLAPTILANSQTVNVAAAGAVDVVVHNNKGSVGVNSDGYTFVLGQGEAKVISTAISIDIEGTGAEGGVVQVFTP